MNRTTEIIAEPGEKTIIVRREFDAPARIVFDAWTRPEYVRRWWSMCIFEMVVCEADVRAGGAWRYVMQAPDGAEHPFRGEYREIERPGRLVYTFIYDVDGIRDHPAVVTVEFEERDGRTTVTSTTLHRTAEARDGHFASGMEEGTREVYAQLDDLLEELAGAAAG